MTKKDVILQYKYGELFFLLWPRRQCL